MFKKTGGGFVFLALLLAGCLYVLTDAFTENLEGEDPAQASWYNKGIFDLVLGIDLDGGAELTYQLDLSKTDPSTKRNLAEDVKEVMIKRLDQYGTSERTISVIGTDKLLVELPGADQAELRRVRQTIEQSGKLTFNLVADEQGPGDISSVERRVADHEIAFQAWRALPDAERAVAPRPEPPDRAIVSDSDDPNRKLVVRKDNEVSGKWLVGAYRTLDDQQLPAIGFEFGSRGRVQFGELTGENVGKRLAIILDGVAMSVANINSRISGRGIIQGVDEAEIAAVVPILKAGSLPAKPRLVNETTIGSVLGDQNVARGYAALTVSFLLVIIFMAFFYLAPGFVADLALILNVVILLAVMILFRNTLTFPGMAGLLLTVGMSVDANILIFERIREEKARGKSLNQAVTAGYQRAFWTIFDANLTTLLTAYILYEFGSGPVKGFAVVLALGIIVSFFTALYVSRLVISFFMKRKVITELRMLQLLKSPSIDFLQFRKPALLVSTTIIVIGLVVLVGRGDENLGIDFTGGTRLVLNLKSPAEAAAIRDSIAGITDAQGRKLFDDVQIQRVGDESGEMSSAYSVRTRVSDKQLAKVVEAQEPPAVGRAVGDEDEEDDDATVQFQELFRDKVAEQLAGQLAPAPFENPTVVVEGGKHLLVQQWHIEKQDGGGVTAQGVQDVLTARGFPVRTVEPVQDGTQLGQNYLGFKVTSEPQQSAAEAQALVKGLESIMLGHKGFNISNPFPEVNSIGGKVAEDLQTTMVFAMLIAILAIIFYTSLRFQFKFGLAAVVALLHDILFVAGVMAIADLLFGGFISLKINLPVVAALLTVVGYSLNDTIVIFDRIRENITGKKRGFDYLKTVNESINQTLSRTVLTSVTTFLVVLILLVWGGESIAAFAFALCVGVVVGTYSSIYVASPALIHFNDRSERRREALLREAAGK